MNKLTNQCQFIGRTGGAVDLRFLPSGTAIGKVSLALRESYKNKDQEWVDKTVWVDLTAFGPVAEAMAKVLGKGDLVAISAKYEKKKYTAEDGKNRYSHNFIVDTWDLLSKKHKDAGEPEAEVDPVDLGLDDSGTEDDLPF